MVELGLKREETIVWGRKSQKWPSCSPLKINIYAAVDFMHVLMSYKLIINHLCACYACVARSQIWNVSVDFRWDNLLDLNDLIDIYKTDNSYLKL